MRRLRNPRVQGALRHLLSSFGPLFAAHGITSELYWQTIVGIVMTSIAFWSSYTAPEKKNADSE
jgi:hypothetical protein